MLRSLEGNHWKYPSDYHEEIRSLLEPASVYILMSARSSTKSFWMATVLERVAQILFCHKETIQRRQGVLVTLKPLKNQWKGRETESLCWTMQTGRCRCQDVPNFGDIFIVCTKSDNTSSNDDFEDLTRDSNLVRVHGLWIAVMASFYCYWIGSSRHWSSLFFSEISLIVNSASS